MVKHLWIFLPISTFLSMSALGAGDSAAEEVNGEETVSLEEVVVTASPLGQEELHIAQPVSVLRGDKLRRRQARTIGETLSHEPGISASDFGQGASRPVIRGLGGSRVRVLEGGIGSMDVSNLSPDHAVGIDPLQTNQIEILKGPSTLLYGSGAIGGIVNMVTNRIPTEVPEAPTGQMYFRHDTATSERVGGGSVDGGLGPFALHLDGLKRATSDYDVPGFASLEPDEDELPGVVENSDVDTDNIAGGASYVGEKGYLGFSVAHFSSNYGVPGEHEEEGSGTRIDLDQLRYDIAGELLDPFPGFSRLKIKLGHNDYEHQEIEENGAVGTTFSNDEYEGRIELLHSPVYDFRGALGIQVRHQDFGATGEEALTPPVVGRSVGVFAVEERDWARWHLEFGARYENDHYDAEAGAPGAEFNIYSLSGGAVWNFLDGYSAALSLTRAQRAPSIDELYNLGPHAATRTFERGNIGLEEETANNLDLTLRKQEGRWRWQVTAFANLIEDFIFGDFTDENGDGLADQVNDEGELDPEGEFLRLDYVQDDALFYGAEFETSYGIVRSVRHGDLDARFQADYVRGKLTNGDNLPRITPPRFGGGLDYKSGPFQWYFEATRVARQNDNAPLETKTAGYTLVETGVSYLFVVGPADFTVSLRGTNLLDEEARRHTSFIKDVAPLPGRSVMLTLQTSF